MTPLLVLSTYPDFPTHLPIACPFCLLFRWWQGRRDYRVSELRAAGVDSRFPPRGPVQGRFPRARAAQLAAQRRVKGRQLPLRQQRPLSRMVWSIAAAAARWTPLVDAPCSRRGVMPCCGCPRRKMVDVCTLRVQVRTLSSGCVALARWLADWLPFGSHGVSKGGCSTRDVEGVRV